MTGETSKQSTTDRSVDKRNVPGADERVEAERKMEEVAGTIDTKWEEIKADVKEAYAEGKERTR